MGFVAAYITCRDEKEAEDISLILLEKRLIACANVFPCKSMYRWKGRVEKSKEFLIIAKTTASKKKEIVKEVKKAHSYDVPCINFLPVEIGNAEYGKWIEKETKN